MEILKNILKKLGKYIKEKYEFALECAKKYIPAEYITGEGGLHIFIKLKNNKIKGIIKRVLQKWSNFYSR